MVGLWLTDRQPQENSLEGKAGLFNLYFKGEYDATPLTADLGKRFEGVNVSFKPWPACRVSHPYIDATLGLVREHDIKPEDVEEINRRFFNFVASGRTP